MLATKFDNTRRPWRRAVAASVVGVAADIERDSEKFDRSARMRPSTKTYFLGFQGLAVLDTLHFLGYHPRF